MLLGGLLLGLYRQSLGCDTDVSVEIPSSFFMVEVTRERKCLVLIECARLIHCCGWMRVGGV